MQITSFLQDGQYGLGDERPGGIGGALAGQGQGVFGPDAQGFGGVVTMQVGVDLNGQVTGVAVTDHKETQSVGTNAMTPEALSRYIGKSGTIRTSGSNSVDAVSGATATSKAITDGVNRALAIVANLDTEGEVEYVDSEV